MTIPNGSRITESIDGIVQGANERGVHLQGEDDWRTFSKWAIKPEGAPARGQRVRLGLDGSGFVRELQVLDDTGAAVAPAPAAAQDRTTVRLRVLEIAAATVGQFAQAREHVCTEHILPLADRLLALVEQP